MDPITLSPEVVSDRVKLPFSFDVERMTEEMKSENLCDFVYYDVFPLTVPRRKENLTGIIDYANGAWADWHDSKFLKESPYFSEVVNTFRAHCDVTLVRLLRLESGAIVKEHTDPTLGIHIHDSVVRFTIPILTDDRVEFYLNDTIVPMLSGECWYLNLTEPHRIVNGSASQRINMSIDMRPNEWVRSLIKGYQVRG